MSLPPLRPYQFSLKENFSSINKNHPTQSLFTIQAPTGSGKTRMFYECTESEPTKKFAMVMPRINLAHQTLKGNPTWGLVQGSKIIRPNARVVLFTLKTLLKRMNSGRIPLALFDFIFIDEAHIEASKDNPQDKELKTLGRLIKKATALGVKFIGMSATLYDAKGNPLEIWDKATELMPSKWLDINLFIKSSYLTPLRYKVVGSAPLDLIMGKNDFTNDSVKKVINSSVIDIVGVTLKERLGSTIVLASSIEHANGLYEDFMARGVSCGVLHSNTTDKQVLNKFSLGLIEIIIAVNMITTGTDLPIARTLVIARPIGSQSLFRQAVGRVLRLYKEKPFSLVIDCFDSIGLCGGHPLLPPPTPKSRAVKKDSKPCEECETKLPLLVVDVRVEIEEYMQYTTRKCQNEACGHTVETTKQVEVIECPQCKETQVLSNIFSSNGMAKCKCDNCGNDIDVCQLESKELMLTFQGRQDAISIIEHDANDRLKGDNLQSFNDAFEDFKIFATLEFLSALVNFFGNVKANYSDMSLLKVVKQMEAHNDKRVIRDNVLINLFIKENIELNYELIDHIEQVTNGNIITQKAIFSRIKTWIKKDSISNTKKFKTNVKRFMGWLEKKKNNK